MNGAAGFDVGGSFVKGGVLDVQGRTLATIERPTPREADPQALVRLAQESCAQWKVRTPIGLAIAGIVDRDRGRLVRSPNLPQWDGVDWKAVFARSGFAIELLNDADAFVLAEHALGAARGAGSVYGLAIGTGVGGGFLTGGLLVTGAHGYAGEPGHMILLADGPKCACGASGCLEALVGSAAIVRRYSNLHGGGEAVTPAEIATRARSGDRDALAAYEETGRYLGLGLASLANLLDPEVFVIGGGVSAAGELLLGPARRTMARTVLHPPAEAPRVEAAALGNAAGWMGAALAAARRREASGRG